MKNPIQIVITLTVFLVGATSVHASSEYYAFISGTLEIWNIDTQSIFDTGANPGDGLGVPGFTITVDPDFTDPTLQVNRQSTVDGYGDYSATSGADATLSASEPFNISVGDTISIGASASGRANRTLESWAASSAAAQARVYFVNESNMDVAVDTLWFTTFSRDAIYAGPDGEDAESSVGMTPEPVYDLGTSPLVFRIAPGEVQELSMSAGASGSAFAPAAVPEPSSMIIWSIGLIVVAIAVWQRR